MDATQWFGRARDLEQRGQMSEALSAFQNGLRLVPDSPDAWFDFGRLLRRLGMANPATEAYGRALALGIRSPEVAHLEMALVHADLRRDDAAAQAALERALSIRPGYAPAWINLGNLHENLGRREEAMSCYRSALGSTDAGSPLADLALARWMEIHRPGVASSEVRMAHARVELPGHAGLERADLAFALGRCFEHAGEYRLAFAAFEKANQIASAGHRTYDPEAAEARFRQQCDALHRWMETGNPEHRDLPTPLFIVGLFRSGSTLLEQMLAAHPGVSTLGESPFFPHVAARLALPMAHLPASDARRIADAYEQHARQWLPQEASDVRFRIDKRPDNIDLLSTILQVRPDSRILVTRRDPRDNGLSIFQHHLDPRVAPYSVDLRSIGHHIALHRRLIDDIEGTLGDRVHVVDYEALTSSPGETLGGVLSWLGLPPSEACLAFHQRTSSVRTASAWQVREPVHARARDRWRPYARWLGPLLDGLEASTAIKP